MSVSVKDLESLSLKVGKIISAERIPGMKKILKVQVDVGEGIAEAIAGGAEFYAPETFVGKRVIVLMNVEPKMIAGVKSEVMLLAADLQGRPVWLTVEEEVPPGTKVR